MPQTLTDWRTRRNNLLLKQNKVNIEIAEKELEIHNLRYQILECDITIENARLPGSRPR